MRNILLLVHPDPGQEARFQAALDLTRALGGHLACLEVTALPLVVLEPVGMTDPALAVEDIPSPSDRLRGRLAGEGVAWDWLKVTDDIIPGLAAAARLADVIVLSGPQGSGGSPVTTSLIARLIGAARKPLMIIPPRLERLGLAGSALVAWDGSIGAATALGAAVPLLALAREVTIFEVGSGDLDVQAEEAATYLSRHGIAVTVARRVLGRRSAGDVIRRFAKKGGFGYVVMGCFGRSPTSEALFGGVTSTMLERCQVPLFLAR